MSLNALKLVSSSLQSKDAGIRALVMLDEQGGKLGHSLAMGVC